MDSTNMEWEKPLPQGRTRSVGNWGRAQAVGAREAPEGHGLEDNTRFRRSLVWSGLVWFGLVWSCLVWSTLV